MGILYFGDNLDILREHIKDESIDLIYLDPPFNSKRGYNVFMMTPKGHESDAQIMAFDDTWHWGEEAEREFSEILHKPNTDVSEVIQSLRRFLNESDIMAYLTMMTNRLLELHRVLKVTGSLYLHCDPTASHYLKVVMDAIFGKQNFRNEIVWCYKRWPSKQDNFQQMHDIILRYSKTKDVTWNQLYDDFTEQTKKRIKGGMKIEHIIGKSGKILIRPTEEKSPGVAMCDYWNIPMIAGQAKERLGYPTQKPLALLERIIRASSNKDDVVLDPFCGCGTAVHAAQNLEREWIGIDITSLAIGLIEKRMKKAFPGISFEIQGTPKDLEGARNLADRDKYQFQWWACYLVDAQPYQGHKKGADSGIDGLIFFQDDFSKGAKKIIVSVKSGENVTRTMIADLKNTVEREKAEIGLFVTLANPTHPMITEAASAGFYESPRGQYPKIQILTIEDLLSGKTRPQYTDISSGSFNFKKAETEEKRVEQDRFKDF